MSSGSEAAAREEVASLEVAATYSRPWRLLLAALSVQVGISVVEHCIPTLSGFIKADYGLSAAATGLVVSTITVGRTLGSYGAGLAADRLGERTVLVVGGLFTGSLAVTACVVPFPFLLGMLILAGVASAVATPAGGRLILLSFPRRLYGLALGIRQTGIPIGGLVAALTLPWIARGSSWRLSLAVAGCAAAAGGGAAPQVPSWRLAGAAGSAGAFRRPRRATP